MNPVVLLYESAVATQLLEPVRTQHNAILNMSSIAWRIHEALRLFFYGCHKGGITGHPTAFASLM